MDDNFVVTRPNVFGFFRHAVRFSPYNCSPGFLGRIGSLFSLLTIAAMIFRIYWMFYQTGSTILSIGWAERNVYAFISFESISCVIALLKVTRLEKMRLFEERMLEFKRLRIHKCHEKHDNYRELHIRILVSLLINFATFGCASAYLFYHKLTIFGSSASTNWYYIYDAALSFLCVYVNFIYLPIHHLVHSGVQREFDVFNDELEASIRDGTINELEEQFCQRHHSLLQYSNLLNSRIEVFMNYSTLTTLTAMVNGLYLLSNFSDTIPLFYFLCLIGISLSISIISGMLMVPIVQVEQSVSKTLAVILDGHVKEETSRIFETISQRIRFNRTTVTATLMCTINKRNVARVYFLISNIVLLLTILSHAISSL